MSQQEDRIKKAIDKHEERLTRQPHPATGRPMSSEDAARRARDLARQVERQKEGKR